MSIFAISRRGRPCVYVYSCTSLLLAAVHSAADDILSGVDYSVLYIRIYLSPRYSSSDLLCAADCGLRTAVFVPEREEPLLSYVLYDTVLLLPDWRTALLQQQYLTSYEVLLMYYGDTHLYVLVCEVLAQVRVQRYHIVQVLEFWNFEI